jgi:hypothetical protein
MKNWPHCPTLKKIRLEMPGIVGLTLDWWLHLQVFKLGYPSMLMIMDRKQVRGILPKNEDRAFSDPASAV